MTSPRPTFRLPSASRAIGCALLLGSLAACAGRASSPNLSAGRREELQEARQYAARASGNYTPPGPAGDPWGPYIAEAGKRFDVPEQWIRAVMHQESGGRLYSAGGLTTSPVGAMGLMQVMPDTYDMLRSRYGLGDDPYDPHNNVLAGTAYMREMYDLYGSPGFLAAYNAGPGRLDDYLTRNRALPEETRRYVLAIGPHLVGGVPQTRSPAEQFAMNAMPASLPAARLPSRSAPEDTEVAYAPSPRLAAAPRQAPTQIASASLPATLPEPPIPASRRAELESRREEQVAQVLPPVPPRGGLRLIRQAMAETVPAAHVAGNPGGGWAIQVGAYGNQAQAHAAAASARETAGGAVSGSHTAVGTVTQGHATLYRARLTGLSREAAAQACQRLSHRGNCIVLSPESQS